jgi:hypothetical protein
VKPPLFEKSGAKTFVIPGQRRDDANAKAPINPSLVFMIAST